MTKASIIVTAYDMESSIDRCLRSFAAQTHTDIDVIVVDCGSTDSTPARIAAFAARDPRFIPVLLPPGGPAAIATATNAGLDLAASDWVCFADGAGSVEPEFVESLLSVAVANNADMAICQYRESVSGGGDARSPVDAHRWSSLRAGLHGLDGESRPAFLLLAPAPWRALYRRRLLEEHRIRFSASDHRPDDAFHWFTIICARSIVVVPAVLCYHRPDASPVTGIVGLRRICDQHEVIRSWIQHHGLAGDLEVTLLGWLFARVELASAGMPKNLRRELFHALRSVISQYDDAAVARALGQQGRDDARGWCVPLVSGDLTRFVRSFDTRPDTSNHIRLGLYHLRHSGLRRTLSLTRQVAHNRFGSAPLARLMARGVGRVTISSSNADLMFALMVLQQEIQRLDRKLDELALQRRHVQGRAAPVIPASRVPHRRADATTRVPASA